MGKRKNEEIHTRKLCISKSKSCQAELTSLRIMGTITMHKTIAPKLRHVATPVARRTVYNDILGDKTVEDT